MHKILFAATVACAAWPAIAQDYADHDGVQMFTAAPCASVIEILETDAPDPAMVGLQGVVEHFAGQSMAWGFILGYDTARGGLHEGDKSTLARLREECAAAPEKTAFEILESF